VVKGSVVRARHAFALTSLIFLGVLAISPAKNHFRPYRSIQQRFRTLGASRARSLKEALRYERMPIAIQQTWLPQLDGRVDRCTTCHLGAGDAVMAGAPEPFRLHPSTAHTPAALDRFGCTSCHGGQGPATSLAEAHGTAEDAGPPMLPTENVEAGCGRCHTGETVAEAPVLSRGRAIMTRFGCYACHLVHGHEDFRADAPPLRTIAVKTGAAWLRLWLKNPKAVDPNTTMPNFELSDDEIEELAHALFARTPPPPLAAAVAAADREPPGDPAAGKKIFAEARCISCHTVEGKGHGTAPELSKVASAATRGWLLAFVRDPHAFNPRTPMPQYAFSESESRDVVAYLEDELRDFDAPKDILTPLRVNLSLAEKGERTFRARGCFSCHGAEDGAIAERFGPELDGIGDKKAASLDFGRRDDLPRTSAAWLGAKVASPRSFASGLKMPSFDLSPEDARAVVTALLALGATPVPESYRVTEHGPVSIIPGGDVGRAVDRLRCLSCHRIGGAGGDISTAPLTFEGSKVRRDWLVDYLQVSYSLRPILEERMPIFRMSRAEAELLAGAITTFYVDPRIPQDPFAGRPASDADAAEGQRLYTSLGCRACHIIGPGGGYVGPPLTDTQTRLQPGWVFTWLKGPQRWRADVRCPDYGLTDTDALRLTAYLETLKAPKDAGAGGKP
jgi:mono/diheme cytochrome c family protein